ncbi:hypothetical protein MHYP_G00247010 [Metynnis hypsauchen]
MYFIASLFSVVVQGVGSYSRSLGYGVGLREGERERNDELKAVNKPVRLKLELTERLRLKATLSEVLLHCINMIPGHRNSHLRSYTGIWRRSPVEMKTRT